MEFKTTRLRYMGIIDGWGNGDCYVCNDFITKHREVFSDSEIELHFSTEHTNIHQIKIYFEYDEECLELFWGYDEDEVSNVIYSTLAYLILENVENPDVLYVSIEEYL